MKPWAPLATIAAVLGSAAIWHGGAGAHGRISEITWNADIAPLLERRCSGCHAAGGVAPLSLSDFDAVSQIAPRLKSEVLARRMPPWHAAPGFGDFANDQSLTPHEIGLVVSWADGGTPRGGAPPAASAPASTARPRPDLVLTAQADTPITARRQRYVLRTRENDDKWIRGWHFEPGNRALVRQAHISLAGGEPLGVWVPPMAQVAMPGGVAQRLRPGESVVVDIEYAQPEDAATDRSRVALFFGARPERHVLHKTLARGTSPLAEDVELLSVRPQMNQSGESLRAVARRPDGTAEPLVWVRHYDSRYQTTYRFRRPVPLPAGTEVDVFSFDGTAAVHLEYVKR